MKGVTILDEKVLVDNLEIGVRLYGGATLNVVSGEMFSFTGISEKDLTSNKPTVVEFLIPVDDYNFDIDSIKTRCKFNKSCSIEEGETLYMGSWIDSTGNMVYDKTMGVKVSKDNLTKNDIQMIVYISKLLCIILQQDSLAVIIDETMLIINK
ncbi:hypothetical protein [Clostridium perfringens]|uniref:hypothetical protein n=1 Tax=Clostridium perfringens TaxID=1502 RepID=UPI0039E9093B